MTPPERIWISPVHRAKRPDDYFLLDPDYRAGRGTEYVRTDVPAAEITRLQAALAAKDALIRELVDSLQPFSEALREGVAKPGVSTTDQIAAAMRAIEAGALEDNNGLIGEGQT